MCIRNQPQWTCGKYLNTIVGSSGACTSALQIVVFEYVSNAFIGMFLRIYEPVAKIRQSSYGEGSVGSDLMQ